MQEPLVSYLISKVLDDIRSGQLIDDEVARVLNKFPLIDQLRDAVEESDVPLLIEMVNSGSISTGNLAVGLLRKFSTESKVKPFLIQAWEQAKEFERKFMIMWRVLDDEFLDSSIHEQIYLSVKENFQDFIEESSKWCGGREKMIRVNSDRLADAAFPSTKDWIYLCSIAGSPDKDSAIKILQSYKTSENAFTAKVAGEMLNKISTV